MATLVLFLACVKQGACVLAGCDFIASIKGVGFKTAHKLLKTQRSLERVRTTAVLDMCCGWYRVTPVCAKPREVLQPLVYNFLGPISSFLCWAQSGASNGSSRPIIRKLLPCRR